MQERGREYNWEENQTSWVQFTVAQFNDRCEDLLFTNTKLVCAVRDSQRQQSENTSQSI